MVMVVSFSVCVVDRERMTSDLDRKHVLLGQSSSTDSARALPTLEESCLVEKMGHDFPLVISAKTVYGGSGYSKARRMFAPAVPLAREVDARIDRRQGLMEANSFVAQ